MKQTEEGVCSMFADGNFLAHHHSDPSLCTQEVGGCEEGEHVGGRRRVEMGAGQDAETDVAWKPG